MISNQEFLQTFAGKYKQSLFNIAYQIICQNSQSLQVSLILSMIQFFQLLYFPFQVQLQYAWHYHKLSSQIQEFLSYFTILRIIINQDKSMYLMLMYFAIIIIFLTTLLVIISAIEKKLQNKKIIIMFLSKSIQFMMTIGFEAIMRILSGLLICKLDKNGTLRMLYVIEQECWVGDYVYHAIVVIISLILLLFLLLACNKIFIDLNKNKKNTFSQKEGSSYFKVFLYVIFSMISSTIIKLPQYSFCVIAIQNITSLSLFFSIFQKRPFYNSIIQGIWVSITGIVFYTNLTLLISFLFDQIVIENLMIGWIITCPMIIVILFGSQKAQIDLLKINFSRYEQTQMIMKECDYLLELVDSSEKNQNKQIQILGFLELHQQTCFKQNCVILINKNLSIKYKDNQKYTDERQILKELINQFYQVGLNKFPQSIDLKLHYSYFLFDYLDDRQKALFELEKAQLLSPDFGQQFQIYNKIRKFIELSFQRQQFGENKIQQTLQNDRNIDFSQNQLKQKFSECSHQLLQFWSQLLEEIPNLQALKIHGKQVMVSIHQIRKQLTIMQRSSTFNSASLKILSKFNEYVFQIIDTVQFASIRKNQENDQFFLESKFLEQSFLQRSEDLGSYSSPILVLELFNNNNQVSIVKNINQATYSLLGYSKTDIIGHPISDLLQNNYSKLHQSLVESYFASDSQDQISVLPSKQLFFQTKSQYAVLIQTTGSLIQTDKGVFLYLKLTKDICYRNFAYIIFNEDGKIENISSTCISILKLDIRKLQIRQLYIQLLFPYLLTNKETYLCKMKHIAYDYQKPKDKSTIFEDEDKEELNSIELMGQLFEIQLNSQFTKKGEKEQHFGYYLKIEQIENNHLINAPIVKKYQSNMQFKYFLEQNIYIYGNASQINLQLDSVKEESEIQEVNQQSIFIQSRLQSRKQFSFNSYRLKKIYGADIKTLRLFQNEIKEVLDYIEEDEYEDYVMEFTENSKQKEEINKSQFNKINSQNDLMLSLQNINYPTISRRLILLNNLFIVALFILACVMYSTLYDTITKFQAAIELATANNQRFNSLIRIQSNLQDLRGCNFNIEASGFDINKEKFVSYNFQELKNELNLLFESNKLLTSSEVKINQKYQDYIDQFEQSIIQMYLLDDSYQTFSYNQAVQQLIARAITLNSSSLDKFNDEQEDFHYYLHNTFNSISKYQYVSQDYYFSNIQSLLDDLKTFDTFFFILSSCCLCLIFLFCQLYVRSHQSNIKNIVSAFQEIKNFYVKQIIDGIQMFMQILETNDDDIDQIDLEEYENQEGEITKKSRKRKSQVFMKGDNKIQIQIIFVSLLFFSYFNYLYFSSLTIINQTNLLIPLVNITSYIPTQYTILDNSIREMLFDENAITTHELNSIKKMVFMIDELQIQDAELHVLNQKNQDILSLEYSSLFNQIYIVNPCKIIIENDLTVTNQTCLSFSKNILQDGLAVAISNFFQNAYEMILQQTKYDSNVVYSNLTYNLSTDHKKNYTYNILNSFYSQENRQIQKVFLKICHLQLIKELQSQLNNYYSFLSFQLTLLFMIFCMITIFIYFIIWIPLLTNFYLEIQKTLEILTIIPIKYLNKIEQLQQYIKNLKEHNY
ncbi:unnamed protein product [Paramecium sonneborni]|uniref:PAS domain-containing protein n=1 Tax=Paramecium sonneborni TaxID=65129 RepID=A0A8S1RNE7_9CILI|nr:unnamed protein product [Paramecium sonneborni]